MKRLYILTLCSISVAISIFFLKKRNPTTIATGEGLLLSQEWLQINKNPKTPIADIRPADQTFLTYPEWFLVFSPEEQANYFKHSTSTSFPYLSHTKQIWQSYKIVNDQIKDNFPINTGYHFMIWVIGTSASFEYAAKALYETVIGRITDTGQPMTEEDKFNTKFTSDYVDFIKDKPWYEFDFKSRIASLWSSSFFGKHFLRKVERKYLLTSELCIKYIYGKLIGLGTQQVYDIALPTSAVLLNNDSLIYLPRYDRFASTATQVAKNGYSFKEIAGNNSAILLTIIVESYFKEKFQGVQTIFIQPLPSNPKFKRIALTTPVRNLNKLLIQLSTEGTHIEHLFDY